jgi:hypothetical protein
MEGESWSSNISQIRSYENLLGSLQKASALFYGKSSRRANRRASIATAMLYSTCWRPRRAVTAAGGQGLWTEYGREICRRAEQILLHDF